MVIRTLKKGYLTCHNKIMHVTLDSDLGSANKSLLKREEQLPHEKKIKIKEFVSLEQKVVPFALSHSFFLYTYKKIG